MFIIANAFLRQDSYIALISAICGITYTFIAGKGYPICYLFGLTGSSFYCLLALQNALWGNLLLYGSLVDENNNSNDNNNPNNNDNNNNNQNNNNNDMMLMQKATNMVLSLQSGKHKSGVTAKECSRKEKESGAYKDKKP